MLLALPLLGSSGFTPKPAAATCRSLVVLGLWLHCAALH